MPTGYTSEITDTMTLQEFALKCARAFGALILMRDDPNDAEIPEAFEASTYHRDSLVRSEARLRELKAMTIEQAAVLCDAEYAAEAKRLAASRAEDAATRARYERMLGLVDKWTPPTKDHVGLKDFMQEQITRSIEFDCHERAQEPKRTPEKWLADSIASAEWSVEYDRKGWEDDQRRARERTDWIKNLRASFRE